MRCLNPTLGHFKRVVKMFYVLMAILTAAVSAVGQTNPLPTGVRLDPEGANINVGNMPLAMTLEPGGGKLIISLGGWRE
jgi:hypothetical protein